MRFPRTLLLACLLLTALPGFAQHFSKVLTFAPGNPFANTIFSKVHELSNGQGYLILGKRFLINPYLVKTDTALNEIWTTGLDFQASPGPYNYLTYHDVGELLNGNYFIFGSGQMGSHPHYAVTIFDTAGNVLHHRTLHETQFNTWQGNPPQIHIGIDSSLIISVSEQERWGFYRLDQQLNVLSSAFFYHYPEWAGRDCIMLRDTNLLVTTEYGLTKCTRSGLHIWSKYYTPGHGFKSLYEAPDGNIYVSGVSLVNGTASIMFEKFDSAGNALIIRHYSMDTAWFASGGWNIYPAGNNLVIYSDSVTFTVDTSGQVLSWGRSAHPYDYEYFKPTHSSDFIISGKFYQDSLGSYVYTIIRFDDTTTTGCLRMRYINSTTESPQRQVFLPSQPKTEVVEADSVAFVESHVQLGFLVQNGCPPDPLGTGPEIPEREVLLYPNPASEYVQLQCGQSQCGITVYDVMGRVVLATVSGNNGRAVIDVSLWADGVYSVVAMEGEVRSVQRFVVKH